MNPEWFYSEGDVRKGPVTLEELQRLQRNGLLKPTDLVWKAGMTDWIEARSVPELASGSSVVAPPDDEHDRPRRRRRRDDYVDDDRPRARRDDDDEPGDTEFDDYDDRPRGPRRSGGAKPNQIQTVGILFLVGGILGLLTMAGAVFGSVFFCCLWPGIYFELVWSIMAIMRGTNMMNQNDQGPPNTLAIMQIICIVNLDVLNCILGVVALVLLSDVQVKEYYRRRGFM